MPRVTEKTLTKSESALVKALAKHKGAKTIDEIATELGKKPNSLTTMLSVIRAKFKLAGKEKLELKGIDLEPKKMAGQGRQSERIDIDDLADDLGDLLEDESEDKAA